LRNDLKRPYFSKLGFILALKDLQGFERIFLKELAREYHKTKSFMLAFQTLSLKKFLRMSTLKFLTIKPLGFGYLEDKKGIETLFSSFYALSPLERL